MKISNSKQHSWKVIIRKFLKKKNVLGLGVQAEKRGDFRAILERNNDYFWRNIDVERCCRCYES
jgi:hypothetical protein